MDNLKKFNGAEPPPKRRPLNKQLFFFTFLNFMSLHLQMCMLGVVSTSDHVSKYCKDMGCIACIYVQEGDGCGE